MVTLQNKGVFMDCKYLAVTLVVVVFLFVFAVNNTTTGNTVSSNIAKSSIRYNDYVDMRTVDYSLEGSCYAKFSLQQRTRFPLFHIYYYCENLPPTKGNDMYHVWLVNSKLNDMVDLGGFKILPAGIGQLDFTSSDMVLEFDKIVMTLERYPDSNPNPSKALMIAEV